jgi:hypothetical protein
MLRRLLPWSVSALALGYVFGYAIEWTSIPAATANANLPLFVAITVFDKLMFFVVWGLIQAEVIRRFVELVPFRSVLNVKGASELLRTVNNSLADAAFLVGVSQLAKGRTAAVIAVASIPFGCHFGVLLLQATLALPILEGGPMRYPGVTGVVLVGWTIAGASAVAARLGVWRRVFRWAGLGAWFDRVQPRQLLPFVGWFVLFAVADVVIQGFASRAFGVPIPWSALVAGIPVLYFVMSIPSLGNFGTREIAWANLFADFGSREELIAFALWTNVIFLVMHVLIGAASLGRTLSLLRALRAARLDGEFVPEPVLHDSIDP